MKLHAPFRSQAQLLLTFLRMDGIREVCTDVPAIHFSIYPTIGTIVYCYLITLDTMSILVTLIATYMLFSKLTYFRFQNNKSELMKEIKKPQVKVSP